MSDKIKAALAIALSLSAVTGCSFWNRNMGETADAPLNNADQPQAAFTVSKNVEMVPLQAPRAVVVCRSKQCAPIKLSMSKEYIYNSLVIMMENNNHQKALLCAADSGSHNCYQNYISLPITVGMTPAYMYIDSVKITDFSINKNNHSVNLMLNYNVTYNGQTPDCAPAQTLLYVKNTDNIVMQDRGYRCKMTTIGTTSVKTLFMVDYIDLDYGFIGGYYSVGLSGPAYGGGTGYMLLRLPKTDYKLLPVLKEKPAATAAAPAEPAVNEVAGQFLGDGQTPPAPVNEGGVEVFPINNKR